MAISETYVDPSIAGASGAGTVGDPYGDLQHALDTMTRDATNGDRINIKAGSDEVLTAALSLATYGTPTEDAELVFQGYTTSAGDGGIGGISGNATYSIFNTSTLNYIAFVDCHLHNSGSAVVIKMNQYSFLINCEVDNTTTHGCQISQRGTIINCYFHNIGGVGANCTTGATLVHNSYFENGTNDFTNAVLLNNAHGSVVTHNIMNLDGSSNGIAPNARKCNIVSNTIYSSSGTGKGIITDNRSFHNWSNNYVEGFSGVGGIGFSNPSAHNVLFFQSNRYYNNATHTSFSGTVIIDNDNSATASSALTDPGSGDFSVGTDLKAGAYPTSFKGSSTNQYMDIGAAQRQEPTAIVLQGRHNVLLRR